MMNSSKIFRIKTPLKKIFRHDREAFLKIKILFFYRLPFYLVRQDGKTEINWSVPNIYLIVNRPFLE